MRYHVSLPVTDHRSLAHRCSSFRVQRMVAGGEAAAAVVDERRPLDPCRCRSRTGSAGGSGSRTAARPGSARRPRARCAPGARLRPRPRSRGSPTAAPRVYGCTGREEELVGGAELDDLAEVHDRDPVGDVAHDAEVVRDEDVGEVELVLQVVEQVEHLRLDRDVERRDRLVGDDQLRVQRERAGDADALALAAGELVRVAVHVIGRQADELEQLAHPLARSPRRAAAPWISERVAEDLPDALARVERGVRVLEDHLHLAPVRAQLAARQRRDVAAVEAHRARRSARAAARAAGRASTCRSPTRRRCRASRRSGPRARRRRPRARRRRRRADAVPRTVKCFDEVACLEQTSSLTRVLRRRARSAARRADGSRWQRVAHGPAPTFAQQRRPLVAASGSGSTQRGANRQPAGGCEEARAAGPGSRSAAGRASGRRAGSSRAAPRCTGAAARGTPRASAPPRRRRPAYMTTTRSAISETTPMSCVMIRIDEPWSRLQPLHQLEDLRLDRHVERRRRLVGDQQRRVARERHRDHRRAAACRPRTRAGSRRRGAPGSGSRPRRAARSPAAAPAASSSSRCARSCSAICQPTV